MTDPLLARLAAADPVPEAPALPAPVLAAEVAALLELPRPRPRAKRRRRRTATLAVLAALVAVPAGAAAVEVAGIHTGFFPGAGDTELVAEEELLDIGDPGIAAVARDVTTGLPLPAGASWDGFLERWPAPEPALMQRTAIQAEAEWYARCRWLETWLAAYRTGDPTTQAAAADVLRRAATWPATVASGGAGPVLEGAATAAASGQARPVRQLARANC